MNSKYVYEIEGYGMVRVIVDWETEEVLFCARDIAKALGYKEPGRVANDRCLRVVKKKHYSPSGMQTLNFISKTEINRLVMSDFNVIKLYYFHELARISDESIAKTRKEIENLIVKDFSETVKMLNRNSYMVEDVILFMPNGRMIHITEDGSIINVPEDADE